MVMAHGKPCDNVAAVKLTLMTSTSPNRGRGTRRRATIAGHSQVAGVMLMTSTSSGEDGETRQQPAQTIVHNDVSGQPPTVLVQAGAITGGVHHHATPTSIPIPRQLPAAPTPFVGRSDELAALSVLPLHPTKSHTSVPIIVICGTGGVGKTSLALHWAHQNLDRFPDGQLFADLRGFSPRNRPRNPGAVVRGFLSAFGIDPARIPTDFAGQVGLYRSILARKRILIVLDNVADSAHAISLLPGSPTCYVLITSRDRLPGVIAAHGAQLLALEPLATPQAYDLLALRLGPERTSAESNAVAALIDNCAGLPLALSIVAGRAIARPGFPLTALAADLADAASRIRELDEQDPAASLPAVLSWYYASLTARQAEVFGLLGLAPGPDISVEAVSGLIDMPPRDTRSILRMLERISLIGEPSPGRWRMHDLVSLYAAERAHHDQLPHLRRAALWRLVGFYTHTAHAAHQQLSPHSMPIKVDEQLPDTYSLALANYPDSMKWFTAEHACLRAAQDLATQHHWHSAVWHLAWSLTTYHWWRGLLHDDLDSWQAGASAAHHLDIRARSRAYRRLGDACSRLGKHDEAVEHLQQALNLAENAGDIPNQAHTHHAFARVEEMRGDNQRALEHSGHALHIYQHLGNQVWEANALRATGWYSARLGDYSRGDSACRTALDLYRRYADRHGEAATLNSLGYIAHQVKSLESAVGFYRQALALFRTLGNTYEEAGTLESLGLVHAEAGSHRLARLIWEEANGLYVRQHRDADAERTQRHLKLLDSSDDDSR